MHRHVRLLEKLWHLCQRWNTLSADISSSIHETWFLFEYKSTGREIREAISEIREARLTSNSNHLQWSYLSLSFANCSSLWSIAIHDNSPPQTSKRSNLLHLELKSLRQHIYWGGRFPGRAYRLLSDMSRCVYISLNSPVTAGDLNH